MLGPIRPEQRQQILQQSVLYGHYEKIVDRVSAYEMLKARAEPGASAAAAGGDALPSPPSQPPPAAPGSRGREPESVGEVMLRSAARAASSQLGRSLIRGVLGSLLGGRR
jgi:hypothetical protein